MARQCPPVCRPPEQHPGRYASLLTACEWRMPRARHAAAEGSPGLPPEGTKTAPHLANSNYSWRSSSLYTIHGLRACGGYGRASIAVRGRRTWASHVEGLFLSA